MKTSAQICWLLALMMTFSACRSPQASETSPLVRPDERGYVSVATMANFLDDSESTLLLIHETLKEQGIRDRPNCLTYCSIMVLQNERERALKALLKNPELKKREGVEILTDNQIRQNQEKRIPVFQVAGAPVQFLKVGKVLKAASIRFSIKRQDSLLIYSVSPSQRRLTLKLIKDNPALKGVDIQLVKQEEVR